MCFGRPIFGVRYEKSTSKIGARFNTSDILLFKSDQHFRVQYYENEVDILGLRRVVEGISNTVSNRVRICSVFVVFVFDVRSMMFVDQLWKDTRL